MIDIVSIILTLAGIILLFFNVWQYLQGQKEKEIIKSQVRVWMQSANGISLGLKRIVADNLSSRYSTTNDVCNAVWSLETSASSLYQSLYEERVMTPEEYRKRQQKILAKIDEQLLGENAQKAELVQNPQKSS